ncbi:MAG TPA: hypothetical protein VF846_22420 [Thermoanaerobaculia bacterium]
MNERDSDPNDLDLDEPLEDLEDPTACAACGSPDISRTPRLLMFAVVASTVMAVGIAIELSDAAFLGVIAIAIYFLVSGRWRCSECGESWN